MQGRVVRPTGRGRAPSVDPTSRTTPWEPDPPGSPPAGFGVRGGTPGQKGPRQVPPRRGPVGPRGLTLPSPLHGPGGQWVSTGLSRVPGPPTRAFGSGWGARHKSPTRKTRKGRGSGTKEEVRREVGVVLVDTGRRTDTRGAPAVPESPTRRPTRRPERGAEWEPEDVMPATPVDPEKWEDKGVGRPRPTSRPEGESDPGQGRPQVPPTCSRRGSSLGSRGQETQVGETSVVEEDPGPPGEEAGPEGPVTGLLGASGGWEGPVGVESPPPSPPLWR